MFGSVFIFSMIEIASQVIVNIAVKNVVLFDFKCCLLKNTWKQDTISHDMQPLWPVLTVLLLSCGKLYLWFLICVSNWVDIWSWEMCKKFAVFSNCSAMHRKCINLYATLSYINTLVILPLFLPCFRKLFIEILIVVIMPLKISNRPCFRNIMMGVSLFSESLKFEIFSDSYRNQNR